MYNEKQPMANIRQGQKSRQEHGRMRIYTLSYMTLTQRYTPCPTCPDKNRLAAIFLLNKQTEERIKSSALKCIALSHTVYGIYVIPPTSFLPDTELNFAHAMFIIGKIFLNIK